MPHDDHEPSVGEMDTSLVCCQCLRSPLEAVVGGLRCGDCDRVYPILGGIPCLVPEPALFQLDWHARLQEFDTMMEAALDNVSKQSERADLGQRTRTRLLCLTGAFRRLSESVGALMAPTTAHDDHLLLPVLPPRLGPEAAMSVLQQYGNVFRDWSWGDDEIRRQLAVVEKLLPVQRSEGRGGISVAVCGAGACRLAFDIHQHSLPAHTFALDVNPLPLTIAHRLIQGETLELPEFPVAPRTEEQVAALHRLSVPTRSAEGLTLMFADALVPPFAAASLDVVVTPWFIDAVGAELAVTACAINRVLRPGGVWINLGPLLFEGGISGQHAIGEVLDVVRSSGFEVLAEGKDEVRYFASPHSASARLETEYWFSASKRAEVALREVPARQPVWLRDPSLPIPATPLLARIHRSSLLTVGVLSMVDGKRSIAEMADVLAASWGAQPAAVKNHLRAYFTTLFGPSQD